MSPSTPSSSALRCHDCGAGPLQLDAGYERLQRVSSDCRPFAAGGQLGVCPSCGLVQAATHERWQQEAREIYGAYSIYHQSGGQEQPVFDPKTGRGRPRSDLLIEGLKHTAALPKTGRLLDIGCGNGGFLRACSRELPDWELHGSEFDTRHRAAVESIRGVEKLHSGSLDEIPGTFDVISLVHVLEHIPGPGAFLQQVARKLAPNGWLLVEVPDCSANPFILLVADHSSHFTPSSLSTVVAKAGLELVRVAPAWVPKEISLVARPSQRDAEAHRTCDNAAFLQTVATEVAALSRRGPFGIFGTSIGATWLDAQTGRTASFFVDEDPARIGKPHEGRPILGVAALAVDAVVYIALPVAIAHPIAHRLRQARPDVTFITPASASLSCAGTGSAAAAPSALTGILA